MSTRALLKYIVALALGILLLFPYFVVGSVVSSKFEIWVRLIAFVALFFSPLRVLGLPHFRLALVFCLPVVVITLIIGVGESLEFLDVLQPIAEPILCVWLGASLACIMLRFSLPRR